MKIAGAATQAVSAVGNMAMGIANKVNAKKNMERARGQLDKAQAFNQQQYQNEMSKGAMDREENRQMLSQMDKMQEADMAVSNARNAIMGGTGGMGLAIAAQQANAKANMLGGMASNESKRRDAATAAYKSDQNNYYKTMSESYANQATQQSKAGDNAFQSMTQSLNSIGNTLGGGNDNEIKK